VYAPAVSGAIGPTLQRNDRPSGGVTGKTKSRHVTHKTG
jgi:hypothetical protein